MVREDLRGGMRGGVHGGVVGRGGVDARRRGGAPGREALVRVSRRGVRGRGLGVARKGAAIDELRGAIEGGVPVRRGAVSGPVEALGRGGVRVGHVVV